MHTDNFLIVYFNSGDLRRLHLSPSHHLPLNVIILTYTFFSSFQPPFFGASTMTIAGAHRKQVLKVLMISLLLDLVRLLLT